jgi:hypothetical protein
VLVPGPVFVVPCALQVCYPKRTDRPLYHGLVTQCQSLGIPFLSLEDLQQQCTQQQQQQQHKGLSGGAEEGSSSLSGVAEVVIDALFGFSFKGTPRAPFDTLLKVRDPGGGGGRGAGSGRGGRGMPRGEGGQGTESGMCCKGREVGVMRVSPPLCGSHWRHEMLWSNCHRLQGR